MYLSSKTGPDGFRGDLPQFWYFYFFLTFREIQVTQSVPWMSGIKHIYSLQAINKSSLFIVGLITIEYDYTVLYIERIS